MAFIFTEIPQNVPGLKIGFCNALMPNRMQCVKAELIQVTDTENHFYGKFCKAHAHQIQAGIYILPVPNDEKPVENVNIDETKQPIATENLQPELDTKTKDNINVNNPTPDTANKLPNIAPK